ncbi:thioesterase domain-containing protein [Streptomyces albus]|uniref:thioesterase II family protein n=1 Tax=Streptomyces albus TaxID=1888 RepID=UPI00340FDC14
MSAYLAAAPTTDGPDAGAPRLFCFHHAGAGALTFARWRHAFAPDVCVLPVRLPGRETRLREPRITDAHRLIAELEAQLGPLLTGPYALYGHSLGALVAHRFAQRLAHTGRPAPVLVGLGACPPPHLPMPLRGHEELPDAALLAALERFGTLPPFLSARPHLLRTLLATLRDDLRLAAGLRALGGGDGADGQGWDAPLACPVHTFAGEDDQTAPARDIAQWRHWTRGDFVPHTLPGGHFFVRDAALPRLLARRLGSAVRQEPATGSRAVPHAHSG